MKRNMVLIQRVSFISLSFLLIFSALALISSQKKQTISPKPVAGNKTVVVMELFTSQGCSSCPPADKLLAEYSSINNENIIPLSFHVDYWNRLGWTDPFSNSAYSARQQWYSQHLPKGSVYTPQLIINGRGEVVGNDRSLVAGLVKKELAGSSTKNISVENVVIGKSVVSFHYTIANAGKDELLNIAIIQKEVTTQIKAGENDGITLTNHNIVRSFDTQPVNNDGSAQIVIPLSFKVSGHALVLYVQNRKDLTISAAVMKDL
ncbi:MAG: DUF1223 domain-containing protein [Bacteroidota bacterium]